MNLKDLVRSWFQKWEDGDFMNIPIEDEFTHTSPFGIIDGKKAYLNMVKANKEAFLGGKFDLHDEIYDKNRACVRYTIKSEGHSMEVSEWFYMGKNKIKAIVSYYHVGEDVSYEKNFSPPKKSD